MSARKKWHAEEIRLAAVAWIHTINDPEVNAADKKKFFQAAVIENLKKLEPPGNERGRYHERGGKHVMDFLRDYVFKEVLKFNDALRIVHQQATSKAAAAAATDENGIMEQQKINMAVAIHRGLTRNMDYHFKNVDPLSWRCYTAWIELRNVPRFKFDPMNTEPPAPRKTNHSCTSAAALRPEATANESTNYTTAPASITAAVDTRTMASTANSSASSAGTKNATVATETTCHLPWGTSAGGFASGFQNTAAGSTNTMTNNNNNNNLFAQFASFQGQMGAFMQNQEMLRRRCDEASSTVTVPPKMDAADQQQQSMVSFYKRKLDDQIAESASFFQMAATYKRQLDEKDAKYKQQLAAKDVIIHSLREQVSGLKKNNKRKRGAVQTADEENSGAGAATATSAAAASAGESDDAAAALPAAAAPASDDGDDDV
jgi:hypothetical protein